MTGTLKYESSRLLEVKEQEDYFLFFIWKKSFALHISHFHFIKNGRRKKFRFFKKRKSTWAHSHIKKDLKNWKEMFLQKYFFYKSIFLQKYFLVCSDGSFILLIKFVIKKKLFIIKKSTERSRAKNDFRKLLLLRWQMISNWSLKEQLNPDKINHNIVTVNK